MEPLAEDDPRQVGGFRLHSRLGAGGMGRVFLGISPAGRPVAVKVIHPAFARDPEFLRRFKREVQAAESVSGAFTAPVVAAGPDDDPPWLATAFVPGPSLADVVAETGPLPEPAVWRLAGGLIEALQAVHARGLVHRDLKPANVLLAADGPRVIDFGISRALEGTAVTATNMVVGTPGFLSPEQASGAPVGPPSDVFALGSVIAFAATGGAPFGTGTPAAMAYRVVHSQPDLSGIPGRLRDLVAGCLVKEPAARPSLTRLMDEVVAGSAAYPGVSPGSFWPEPVAGLVNSQDDAGRTVTGYRVLSPGYQQTQADAGRRSPARRGRVIAGAATFALGGVAAALVALYVTRGTSAGPHAPTASTSTSSTHAVSQHNAPSATPGSATSSAAPVPTVALTKVLVCSTPVEGCSGNYGTMNSRPARIQTSGDGTGYVNVISWTNWGRPTATAKGTLEENSCSPSCATGKYTGYPATVTLSGLSPYANGAEAYSTMVISAPTAPNGHNAYDGLVP